MLSTCCNVLYIYLVTLCPCTVSAPRSHNCRPGHRHAMSDVPGHQNEWFSGCQLAVRGANVSNGTGKTRRWHRSEHCGAGTLCNNTKNRKNRTGLNRGGFKGSVWHQTKTMCSGTTCGAWCWFDGRLEAERWCAWVEAVRWVLEVVTRTQTFRSDRAVWHSKAWVSSQKESVSGGRCLV